MSDKYILDGHEVMPESNLMKWAMWFESADRAVKKTAINDSVQVSTVFLGLDHNYGDGPPILFETMIFGGEHDEEMERCSTWSEAEQMHERMIKRARHV